MKKVVKIEGMHCEHCSASVKKALEEIDGVSLVKVNLKKKCAVVVADGSGDIESAVSTAVSNAGFEVVSIEDKKGLF